MTDDDNKMHSPPAARAARPSIRLEDLLKGRREVVIVHGVDEYLLRVTRNGKLILTK
jgi:hemin uptake protein HemP